jgi:hypothetical protein
MANLIRIPWREWIPRRFWRIVAVVEAADQIPEKLPIKGAVLVGPPLRPKWLAFDCPCKTGHRILVTLDTAHHPHWRIINNNKLSISPSVDYCSKDLRCHYMITGGKIIWVKNKERHADDRKR